MKITVESTEEIVELAGKSGILPTRIWEGQTDDGIPVKLFVTRVAVREDQPADVFERFARELTETAPLRRGAQVFDLRYFVD